MSDALWRATLDRVRGEFEEMPCLRVTCEQARALFGLTTPAAQWVLNRLTNEGFLSRTAQGDYVRKNARP
jgi:predicted transcriptional regulator of viral defense system